MADEIKADYDQLEAVASRFNSQSQVVQEMLQQVRRGMEQLEGEWIGRGSDAFFAEMQSEVLPASMRLQQVLEDAGQVTRQISQTLQQADEEASRPFQVS
jgi:WXG100 family type VII secretion target